MFLILRKSNLKEFLEIETLLNVLDISLEDYMLMGFFLFFRVTRQFRIGDTKTNISETSINASESVISQTTASIW